MPKLVPERIEALLQDVENLPTLPEVPTRVLQMAMHDEVPLKEFGAVIQRDPAIAANVLRLANSAYYGFTHKVSTLTMAVSLLGINEIVNLVCGVGIVTTFGKLDRNSPLDSNAFWRHSLGCAIASKLLCETCALDVQGTEFVAGLIHDIGILIQAEYLPGHFRQVHDMMEHSGCSMSVAEQEVLGVTHAEIGAWIAKRWALPTVLCEAIAFHHAPLDALSQYDVSERPVLAAVVHLADRVAGEDSLQFPETDPDAPLLTEDVAWRIILAESPNITPDEMTTYADAFAKDQSRIGALLGALLE